MEHERLNVRSEGIEMRGLCACAAVVVDYFIIIIIIGVQWHVFGICIVKMDVRHKPVAGATHARPSTGWQRYGMERQVERRRHEQRRRHFARG